MPRPTWQAPAGSFAAVLGAVVVAALVADTAGRGVAPGAGGRPRPLPIGAPGTATVSARGAEDALVAPAPYGWGHYTIRGDLGPLPGEGPAYRLEPRRADEAAVRRVAAALGLTSDPVRVEHGWEVRGTTRTLVVHDSAGNPWHYDARMHRCDAEGADCAVAHDSVQAVAPIACPPPPDGAEPAVKPECAPAPPPSPPPAPSERDTIEVTRRVLAAAGYDVAAARISTEAGWGDRTGVVDPVVGGLPTLWWSGRVSVDVGGEVVRANGFLGMPTLEDDYPLLTVQQAIDRMRSGPEPMVARCMAMTPECTTDQAPERTVTAARLGLVLAPSYQGPDAAAFLVPTWLLTVEGTPQEEPLVALPDEYVEQPPEPSVRPEPDGGSGGATGGSGGGGTEPDPGGAGGEPPTRIAPVPPQEPEPAGEPEPAREPEPAESPEPTK